MDRALIERLLLAHVNDLENAIAGLATGSERELYRGHLSCTCG